MARPWEWDADLRRYRAPNGRFIGQKQMLEQRDRFQDAVKQELVGLGQKVANGEITVQQYVTQGRDIIKSAHVDMYALSVGGRNSMTASDWGKVGAETKKQYGYWQGFAEDIAQGDMTEAGIMNRAGLYGNALVSSYSKGSHSAAKKADLDEQRNVLGGNDAHCDACLEETDKGWVSVNDNDFSQPGERECGPNCHCSVEFRTRPSDEGGDSEGDEGDD